MTPQDSPMTRFLAAVRRRLNVHGLWKAVVWAAAVGTSLMLLAALVFVIRGYAVPTAVYWAGGCAILLLSVVIWFVRRANVESAAAFADTFYELDDAVTSCHHFQQSGKSDGFYALQSQQTEQRVQALSPEAIRMSLSRRALVVALGCGAIAILLGFKAPSPEVLQRLALEQRTLEQTGQINRKLKDEVEQLKKSVKDPNEEKLLEPNKLRRWVDELKQTKQRKEALRQYAKLERKLKEASARLLQKRDEQMLERAAKQLDKDRATKPLAKQLKQKEYDKAAAELNKFRPTSKKLDQQRKELARLKAAAKRMAAAATARKPGKKDKASKTGAGNKGKPNQSSAANSGKTGNNAAGSSATAGQSGSAGSVEDAILELDAAVDELDEALKVAEIEKLEKGQCDNQSLSQCDACRLCVGDKLDELGRKLRLLALKRRVQCRLAKLCKKCSNCQAALCVSAAKGGKKAGWGSVDSRRDKKDKLTDNGQYTRLQGLKGNGPSLTTVESADEGSGVSTRHQTVRERTFQRQVESFVQREDVPEEVKTGVKTYFENIHAADEPKK